MRIVLAPDSFKGSLTAREACEALEAGLRDVWGDALEVVSVPMADGGEGLLDSLLAVREGERRARTVTGPLGEPVDAEWGLLSEGGPAVVEMARASGLLLVPPERRDPGITTTRGTGELIAEALGSGARQLLVGIGGSATNDGGAGMAQALGYRLLDAGGTELPPGGLALERLERILPPQGELPWSGVEVLVACDVTNPLCGEAGASRVYGPQKGATPEQAERLDAALLRLAAVVERDLGLAVAELPGAGAAGGLGAGLVAFLGARLRRGVELVVEATGLQEALRGADLCLTGEGSLDAQTLFGKTPWGVAQACEGAGVPCVALGGRVAREARGELEGVFRAVLSATDASGSLEEILRGAGGSLRAAARTLARSVDLGRVL